MCGNGDGDQSEFELELPGEFTIMFLKEHHNALLFVIVFIVALTP